MKRRHITALLLAAALTLSLTACGAKKTGGGETELKELTFVLDWTPNTNHTGVYAAIANGYFEEAGLSVKVVQPAEDGAEMMVASGQAQFGVSAQGKMADALGGASPMPITAVAAVLQHNTAGIISRKGEGLNRPKGMEGHKYTT